MQGFPLQMPFNEKYGFVLLYFEGETASSFQSTCYPNGQRNFVYHGEAMRNNVSGGLEVEEGAG